MRCGQSTIARMRLGVFESDRHRQVRRVARWLQRVGLDQVSREDIRREALLQSVDAEAAEHVIDRLETAGVLRILALQAEQRRGPRRRRWEVHPEFRK